jgi:SAM-dependent methyltransferase
MTAQIQADFDRIARLSGDGWNHNNHYHNFLLKHLPPRCETALDIGCGTGNFARLLAERANKVIGLDLSPEMIRLAREQSTAQPNIEYQVADVLAWDWPVEGLDGIASIATLHHLPLDAILEKARTALRPGGVLLVLDLFEYDHWTNWLSGTVAVPVNLALRLAHTGRLQDPPEVRAAWEEHGKNDRYLTVTQVKESARILPGAQVRKHLLWRYSLIWKKP